MKKQYSSTEALCNPKQFYDARFQKGYMQDFSDIYEACRLYAIKEILNKIKCDGINPRTILDYGCGEGRYIGLLEESFSEASIVGCDISNIGLQIAKKNHQNAQFVSMEDEAVNFADNSFDLIISIEVFEHVKYIEKAIKEICLKLRSGGIVIISTPCANKFSLEWFLNKFINGLQPTPDGIGRFATDEPAHLRRLNDKHIRNIFSQHGVDIYKIYHRAHFFETIIWGINWSIPIKLVPSRLGVKIALLDWHFKNYSNGASLIAVGKKIWQE